MNEKEAKAWLDTQFDVSRETWTLLENYVHAVLGENVKQNLIAQSTIESVWTRHIADSAQLLLHAPEMPINGALWIDLGSGPGLPGLVIAILSEWPVLLVESRSRRGAFLSECINALALADRVRLAAMPLKRLETVHADVISARAFAPLDRLLNDSVRFSTEKTCWLLPKGRNAATELQEVSRDWRLTFHVEQSITDRQAGILVGSVQGARTKR